MLGPGNTGMLSKFEAILLTTLGYETEVRDFEGNKKTMKKNIVTESPLKHCHVIRDIITKTLIWRMCPLVFFVCFRRLLPNCWKLRAKQQLVGMSAFPLILAPAQNCPQRDANVPVFSYGRCIYIVHNKRSMLFPILPQNKNLQIWILLAKSKYLLEPIFFCTCRINFLLFFSSQSWSP